MSPSQFFLCLCTASSQGGLLRQVWAWSMVLFAIVTISVAAGVTLFGVGRPASCYQQHSALVFVCVIAAEADLQLGGAMRRAPVVAPIFSFFFQVDCLHSIDPLARDSSSGGGTRLEQAGQACR
eukprot:365228-Chlamydomonas_euryale.AAC.39